MPGSFPSNILRNGSCLIGASGGSSPTYEPETLDWAARVQAQGGSVLLAIDAVDTYIKGCKAAGLWVVMTNNGLIMVFATDGFAGLFVPLIAPAGVVPANVNFVAGDYSLATGLNPGPSNSTKHLNLNYSAATHLSVTDAQISVYCRENRNRNLDTWLVGAGGASNQIRFSIRIFDANFYVLGGTDQVGFFGTPNSLGLHTFASEASGARAARNGSTLQTYAARSGSLPTESLFMYARNNGGTPGIRDNIITSYLYTGRALSAAQEALHAPLVEALQDSLGRGVI